MEKINVTYDGENDILFLYKEGRAKGSIEIGDFIINFTENMNKAVGIEILNATKMLSELFNLRMTRDMLSKITKASFKTVHRQDVIYIHFGITWLEGGREETMSSLIPVPQPLLA